MRTFAITIMSFMIIFAISAAVISSQGDEQALELLEFTDGVVLGISAQEMTLKEYDYDAEEEVNVSYLVDPKVKIKDANSIQDIAVNDTVFIEYAIKDNKRIVKIMTKVIDADAY